MTDGAPETIDDDHNTVVLPKRIKARDTRSDELKAAAIVGVVCIHAGCDYFGIFRCCVPVFVAIWAYHYELGLIRRDRTEIWQYVRLRFIRLVIPFLFWTAVYTVMTRSPVDWKTTPLQTIIGGWMGGYGWAGQYFFIILFQLTWLMPLFRRWVNPSTLWHVVIGAVVVDALAAYWFFRSPVVSGIGDRLFVYWLGYVFLGIAFARGYPRLYPFLLLVSLVLVLTSLEFNRHFAGNMRSSVYLLPTVTVGSSALLLAIGPRALPGARTHSSFTPWFRSIIQYVGRNSFVVYVGHPLFLNIAHRAGAGCDDLSNGLLIKVVIVVAVIAASLALGKVLRWSSLGSLIGN